MPAPAAHNLTIVQGDDFSETFTFKDSAGAAINLTGYTFAAQVRPTAASAVVTATFTVAITSAAGGTITLTLARAATALLLPGTYRWDLEWTDTLDKKRTLLNGAATVVEEVTR